MARPCKYCGQFILDPGELLDHENTHRDLERWSRLEQSGSETHQYWQLEDSPVLTVPIQTESNMEAQEHDNGTLAGLSTEGSKTTFSCPTCHKTFASRYSLLRHQRSGHGIQQFTCESCEKRFTRLDNLQRHQLSCNGKTDHICPLCQKRCSTAHGLRRHLQWHQKAPVPEKTPKAKARSTPAKMPRKPRSRPTQFRCRRCTEVFTNRQDLHNHRVQLHYTQEGGALQPRPWGRDDIAPWGRDAALRRIYEINEPIILEHHQPGPIGTTYNFPVTNDVDINQLMRFANDVYQRQQRAFRLNLVFGVILQHRETHRYKYFVPYTNSGVFERPIYISRRADLQRLRRQLETKDILQELLRQRPDTKWVPVLVTNVHLLVTETFYPVGQGELPDYLSKKDSLYPLVKNRQTGKPYKDNLCAFRCLALHNGYDIKSIEEPTKRYFRQWTEESPKTFEGVSFEEFPAFESKFNVNMEIYSLQEDGFARSVYKSRGHHDNTMYVNLYQNHLSYIRDFAMYAQKYQCRTCDRHFDRSSNLHRHQNVCANKTRFVYPGGFHQARESIFEQLDQYEIHVPEEDRTFTWFMCYDFEALLRKVEDRTTESLQWTAQHDPISVSISSNVEGFEESICLIEPDQDLLVKKMVSRMNQIADTVYELAEEKWGWVLEAIDETIDKCGTEDIEALQEEEDGNSSSDEVMDEATEDDREPKKPSHPLKKIYGYMETYMTQVPVLGFNSAKYDLNLIKRTLAKHLNMHEDSSAFVVKNNNAYMCLATDSLKFLDMSQFLAAGSSYAGFLKAYHVEERKGYFPYEWFDKVDKLDSTSLPPYEDFYSHLKGTNISEEEYRYCETVWQTQQMTTFRDFLVWYNNLDVGPFVEAVRNFQKFYFEKGVDVFKTAISVPGIARQLLFKTARKQNANFALFDKSNEDLYRTVKNNIVGGPSIIFTRHHCAGQTKIRGEKPCGAILGFDANALYLQAIGQPMPVGPFVRRLADNDFRPQLRDKYMSAYYWMDWLSLNKRVVIQHKLNTGREVRIGKYLVDGFLPATQPGGKATVYEMNGCWFHAHENCEITRGIRDEKWHATRAEKYKRTQERSAFLKREHNVIEIWECEYRRYCRQNPRIYQFIDDTRPRFYQQRKGKSTEDDILRGVCNGDLFGMVEVDIEVPQEWPSHFRHPTLSPYDYFQEMSPFFCTTDIPFDAIGDHMQGHIWEYQLSDQPRRLLVGGMKARQILLATPLLRWYMNHGLKVSRIYQVVEYKQQRCFEGFVREVSDARRQGDTNPDTQIIADTMKVIGNSGYGSLIMDKTKHRDVKYVQGENQTCLKVNDPLFRKLDCLDAADQYYEVEMAKRKIKLDLPIQLGYFILQYAKLRMLEFYFDFMDVFVDRSDFEYLEMDTDSAYMAISGSCLEEVIKPEMKQTYQQGLTGFCTDTDVEADSGYHWFPRSCCPKHANYDKRTPGLFKLEYQGDEMIGLCSKTYIVRKTEVIRPSSKRLVASRLLNKAKHRKSKPERTLPLRRVQMYKFSSKGVSKRHLTAPMAKYRRVLNTRQAQSGQIRGFRVRRNAIFTYTQERRGFSYLYCKRKVLDDGIHTVPLDITLCPIPPNEREVDDRELVDMLANQFED